MALLKHVLQSKALNSGVHCARVYNFCDLVNSTSSVANLLLLSEAAFSAKSFNVVASKSKKRLRSESGTLFSSFKFTPGTMLFKKERFE